MKVNRSNFFTHGLMQALGFDITDVNQAGNAFYEGYFPFADGIQRIDINKLISSGGMLNEGAITATGRSADVMQKGMFAVFGGLSVLNVGMGFQEGGVGGALGAAYWDIAYGAGFAANAYTIAEGGKASMNMMSSRFVGATIGSGAGTTLAFGASSMVGGAIGSGVGYVTGSDTIGGLVGGGITMAGTVALAPTAAIQGGRVGVGAAGFAARNIGKMGVAGLGMYAAYQAAKPILRGTSAIISNMDRPVRGRGIDTSGNMSSFMTQGAFTMRERAVQAIHKSHMNSRSALGSEASFMHMPQKNYHSRYKRGY